MEMTLLSQIVQYAISGITSGSIYAILGICWSTVYLISGVLNFTTGEFAMLGGMLTWVYIGTGMNVPAAVTLAILSTIIIAILLERLVIRSVKYPAAMTYMLITIASASVIRGVILLTCGSETRSIPAFLSLQPIGFLGATFSAQVLVVIGVLLAVTVGLALFFERTLFGKALRASAINQVAAGLFGMNVDTFRLFCFALAGALGSVAGIVIAPIAFTGYNVGMMAGIKGLVVAIVGNFSLRGTVIGGLALGLLEGFAAGFVSSGWRDAIALLVMVVYLIVRTFDFSRWPSKVRT